MTEADRDEKVARAYRALGGEEPPRALDEAILAASRRSRGRWRVPLSIAAVLVLAVGVTLRMLPPQPDAELVALAPQVIETPRPAAVPAPASAGVVRRVDTLGGAAAPRSAPAEPAQAAANVARSDTTDRAAKQEAARREMAAGPAAVPEARTAAVGATTEARQPDAARAPSAPLALSAAKLAEPALTPEAWLERIAEMRKQGREREAQDSLAEFKKRYPDYKIPEALTR